MKFKYILIQKKKEITCKGLQKLYGKEYHEKPMSGTQIILHKNKFSFFFIFIYLRGSALLKSYS